MDATCSYKFDLLRHGVDGDRLPGQVLVPHLVACRRVVDTREVRLCTHQRAVPVRRAHVDLR